MSFLQGIAASHGIAIAKAYRLVDPEFSNIEQTTGSPKSEAARFQSALNAAKEELEQIQKRAGIELGAEHAAIFEAHLLILRDSEFIIPIEKKIKTESVSAEYALKETAAEFVSMFDTMEDKYIRERAADIRDVTKRILGHLLGIKIPNPSMIFEEVIVVAADLTPSDTVQLNRHFVKGFTTDNGGMTSHSAIIARSMDIPAVVGTMTATAEINNGDLIVVDGIKGEVHINPTPEMLEVYKKIQADTAKQKKGWAELVHEKTVTTDNYCLKLTANITSSKDLKSVIENGAEGIGLYRTEFLYMCGDRLPTENEQFTAYKMVLERMGGNSVVIRTLDIGGDKELPYLDFPKESNPALGHRAIRFCLKEQKIFRTQLRALLRASIYGNLNIMFPMIATLNEFRMAKDILAEEKHKLLKEGIRVSEEIKIGMMVEIPSTAVLADRFAKEVDFFSIGTNDLTQYTLAADRMNQNVSHLNQSYNPAIFRLIKLVVDAAKEAGKPVGICGELAADVTAIPILIGFGLDQLSMSAANILRVRSCIRGLSKMDMEALASRVLELSTSEEVIEEVNAATL